MPSKPFVLKFRTAGKGIFSVKAEETNFEDLPMETVLLSNQNPVFTIWGSEEKMSAEILKVILKETSTGQLLNLIVQDENGFIIYTKPLLPKPADPDAVTFCHFPEIPVNKRIIFNAFITVSLEATKPEPFAAEVQFV